MPKTIAKKTFRKFVNADGDSDTASVAVFWEIAAYDKYKGDKKVGLNPPCLEDCDLEIRSCRDTARLHFSIYEKKTLAQRRRKLQILRDALDVVEAGLDRYETEVTKK